MTHISCVHNHLSLWTSTNGNVCVCVCVCAHTDMQNSTMVAHKHILRRQYDHQVSFFPWKTVVVSSRAWDEPSRLVLMLLKGSGDWWCRRRLLSLCLKQTWCAAWFAFSSSMYRRKGGWGRVVPLQLTAASVPCSFQVDRKSTRLNSSHL